jgi:hypothetical protein
MFSQQNGFSPPTEPVTGSFIALYNKDGPMNIDTVLVNNSGANVIYLSRFENSSGDFQYSYIVQNTSNSRIMLQRQIGNVTQDDELNCGAIDDNGNIFVAGQYESSTGNPGFLAKYGNTGNLLWQREYYRTLTGGNDPTGYWYGCDVENGGANVYVAGYTVYVDGANLNGYTGIVKYNTNGNMLASYKAGNRFAEISDLVVDSSNNYIVCGDIVVANINDAHGSVEKFYANGTQVWANALRISNIDTSFTSLAIDSANNVVTVGQNNIVKFYANGSVNWVTQGVDVIFSGVAVDSSDNIYISGIKGNGFPYVGYYSKFYSNGTPIFQNTIDYTGNANASVTCQTEKIKHTGSNVYIGGRISTYAEYPNTNPGYEGFSAKLPDDGSGTGTYAFFDIASNATTYSTPSYNLNSGGFGLGSVGNTTNAAATATSSNGNIRMRIVPL